MAKWFIFIGLMVLACAMIISRFLLQPSKNQTATSTVTSSIIYFAYGSNLSKNNMYSRCGSDIETLGPAKLLDYDLTFDKRGYANIIPSSGKYVWGLVWRIDEDCLKELDIYEGYPTLYGRQTVAVELGQDNVAALVYIEPSDQSGGQPNRTYLEGKVIPGAEEHHLPPEWVNKLKSYYK
jgi:gamma-glutamylcyclotransferase (GGCT)/AIG2-like uncharacterized protein YtfP